MTKETIKALFIGDHDDEDDFLLTRQLFALIKAGRYVLDWAPSCEEGLRIAKCQEHDISD